MFRVFFGILLALSSIVNGQIITTVAGNGAIGYGGDGGVATAAKIGAGEVEFDGNGILYIGDTYNNRIRKINFTTGIITLVAGNGSAGFSGDGAVASSAQLSGSTGIAVDRKNNLYIADGTNHRIRKIDIGTGIITTFAGDGTPAFAGDGGLATAASLYYPGHLTFDKHGNLFISDVYNRRIRKVDTFGIISTVVGNGSSGSGGDGGPATAAELDAAHGLVCDSFGNLYISDPNSARIRKVSMTTGLISTFAGDGTFTYVSDEVAATSTSIIPQGLAFDFTGNLYVACGVHNRVRMIDTAGVIHAVCGTGIAGYNGDNIRADTAKLYQPYDVAFDACWNLYIADGSNKRIRKITYPSGVSISISVPAIATLGSSVTVTSTLASAGGNYTVKWYNKGILFATTTTPSVTYTKTMCTDSITAVVYGCSDSAVSNLKVVGCNVGTSPLPSPKERVTCYPNPVNGELIISAGARISDVMITNLMGIVVFKETYNGEEMVKVDMRGLASGLYFLKVACPDASGGRVYVERVVKE